MDVFIGGAAADGDCFKGDAMTHDELVRFAAGKLRGKLKTVQVLQDGVDYTKATVDGPGVILVDGIDLTSPELFLKGLEAFDKVDGRWVEIQMSAVEVWISKAHSDEHCRRVFKDEITVREIPETFWQCWAELEGGQG